ncbi:structure-specific endonuclease subunit SLX1-like [Clytia hemisphaerica]
MDESKNIHLVKKGEFYGVYILLCKGPERKGDVYIGFTVNPRRRIRQHNRELKGGAWKTKKNKGNWEMVLIIHGFRSQVSALQFEWAWQNPLKSKRLNHMKKLRGEKKFDLKLRALSEMLNTGPWNRLPLTIQWLKQEYQQNFPVNKPPPIHMPIAYGPLRFAKETSQNTHENVQKETSKLCYFCNNEKEGTKEEKYLSCIVKSCEYVGHITCYAQHFLTTDKSDDTCPNLLPVSGVCPGCKQEILWGDLVRQRQYTLEEADEGSGDGSETEDGMFSAPPSQDDDSENEFDQFQ